MTLQTVDEKIDSAVHAAMTALGLSAAMCPDTADALNDAIGGIARNIITDDDDEACTFAGIDLPVLDKTEDYTIFDLPDLTLSEAVTVMAGLEIWHDNPRHAEITLTNIRATNIDIRDFLTVETKEKIKAHLKAVSLDAISVSPRELGALNADQIIYNVEIDNVQDPHRA